MRASSLERDWQSFLLFRKASAQHEVPDGMSRTLVTRKVPDMCYTVLEPWMSEPLGVSMRKENQTTAILEGERLSYQRDGQHYHLRVGSSAWYGWLQTATRFRVRSPSGTFSIRREQAGHKRGDWYWRAYRKRGGRLQRVYLGKTEELTLDRLQAVAARLSEQDPADQAEPEPIRHALHPATALSHPPDGRASTLPRPLTSLLGRKGVLVQWRMG